MAETSQFYLDGSYLKQNPDWHVSASPWKARAILQMIEKHGLKPQQIGEVGCGAGEILRLLQMHMDEGVAFTGYDIAPQAIEMAQQRANQHLQFHLRNYVEQPEGQYDLLLLIDVVTHFENCLSVLRSLRERSDYTILQIALDVSALAVLRNDLFRYWQHSHHLHYWDKNLALAVLQEVGYEILDFQYTRPPLDLLPWSEAVQTPRKLIGKCWRSFWGGLKRLPADLCYLVNKDFAVRCFGGWRLLVLVR